MENIDLTELVFRRLKYVKKYEQGSIYMKSIRNLAMAVTLITALSTFTFAGGHSSRSTNSCSSCNSGGSISVGNLLDKTGDAVDKTLDNTGSLLDEIIPQVAICLSLSLRLC